MRIGASHILVSTLEEATNIKQQLDEGASFQELAAKHSKCPSGRQGGNLGVFEPGQMVKPFEDAAMATAVGRISGPVQTQFGYHLIYRTA